MKGREVGGGRVGAGGRGDGERNREVLMKGYNPEQWFDHPCDIWDSML